MTSPLASLPHAKTTPQHLAVIGAGWAGIAAAVAAVQAGHNVCLYEAARTPGGRARTVDFTQGERHYALDNGQHILIGAYAHCLALMAHVGVDTSTALLRTPLDLRDVHGRGLRLPKLPQPFNGLVGILQSKGWTGQAKIGLLWKLHQWQRQRFQAPADQTVAQLCAKLLPAITAELIEPLCVAGMNTPIDQASARVFLRMLQDSLLGGPGSSDLLLPRVPLGQLLAEPALQWLAAHGAQIRLGQRVGQITPPQQTGSAQWHVDDEAYDSVVIATHSAEALRLVEPLAECEPSARDWLACTQALQHESIASVYLQHTDVAPDSSITLLPRPMAMLACSAAAPAQFVFDRGQLGGPSGLLAFVISASRGTKQALEAATLQQAQALLASLRTPTSLEVIGTVVEKRATFACTAGVLRPCAQPLAHWPSLQVCGDYIQGPYPGTLEGAVLSGQQAAHATLL